MRKIKILLLSLTIAYSVSAQESVQWASEVMFVTSEIAALQYAASQTLHSPNVYPKGGESPNAWRPSKTNNDEYIVVKFAQPIRAQQIAIAETENPGAVSKVFAYDSLDNEYLLFDLNPRPIPLSSRLLNLFFQKTPYRIAYIRIDLACGSVPGYNSIDAIGLSTSNIPISVLIELAPNVNQELTTEKLSANVNSSYIEQSPLLSPDGKTLYFSRRGHPENIGGVDDYEDIWYSDLDEETQEWLPAKNLGPPLNTAGPNFICSISEVNGQTVLLLGNQYGKKGRMLDGISITRSKGPGKWEKPTNVVIENPYNYSEQADYYLSQDTKVIMMSMERDDTFGDRDLYVSFENPTTNIWTEPLNLGSAVNSADTEYAPFLDKDNKTLYFSSEGFKGYGGADIYVSKRLDDTWTNWSSPENMGRGVNGPQDDTYFNIPTSGSHAYFTRGSTDENTDVYRFRIDELFIEPVVAEEETDFLALIDEPDLEPIAEVIEEESSRGLEEVYEDEFEDLPVEEIIEEVAVVEEPVIVEPEVIVPVVVPIEEVYITIQGNVKNSQNNDMINADVIVERLPDGVKVGQTKTDANGHFEFKVRPGARYGFMADKDGFMAKSENVDLNDVTETMSIKRDLQLSPIQKGAAVVVNNIFFDFDEAELTTASYSELQRIAKLLIDKKVNKIEISGHTDSIGDEDYNKILSTSRAMAVYNYFISEGINENRITVVGYGESLPITSNDTAENRRLNRRVEFKILD